MDLVLSVVADPQGANMLKHTKLFTAGGGSIGRADSNDWVLPDPQRVVSSQHALIHFSDSQYFLEDHSTNGTYYNGAADPLGKGNKAVLNDGDIISIGDYQLKVTIRRPQADAVLPGGLGDADFLDSADRTTFSASAAAKMQNQAEAQQLDSWLEPGAAGKQAQTGEWGYLGNQASAPVDELHGQESLDPLAAFSAGQSAGGFGTAPTAESQWSDDDWWKDGSEQDHAPADRHAMQFRAQAPEPAVAAEPAFAAPPAPQPQPQSQPQFVPAAAPPPADNNPFADSFAEIQGQQVSGVPGFADAGQRFSQLPPTPSAPAPAPQVTTPQVTTPPIQPAFQPQAVAPRAVPPQVPQPAAQPTPQPAPQPAAPQPASAPQQQVPGGGALAATLGLNLPAMQQAEVDAQAAAIVQETVARLIDLLRARTSIKNELRVQRTMIQTEANNPLKFSASAADALAAMFAGNGAFMTPQQAVRDSFDDLSDHQVAVLAGMRAGYDAMLRFFSPENIERRSGAQGGVFSNRSARNWDGFVALYREQVSDPEACYRRLFGDEFATTYEHQLSELKNARSLKGG